MVVATRPVEALNSVLRLHRASARKISIRTILVNRIFASALGNWRNDRPLGPDQLSDSQGDTQADPAASRLGDGVRGWAV